MRWRSLKPLAFSLAFLGVVVLSAAFLLDTWGLALFNMVFGRTVHAVVIRYDAYPESNLKGELTSAYFTFNFSIEKTRVPIESLLSNCRVEVVGGQPVGAKLKLHIFIYVLNRVPLFQGDFNFEDLRSRMLTVYLQSIPSDCRMVYVEVSGSCLIGSGEAPLSYGGALTVE
ncbi:MAG: hypothetical protein ACPL4I_12205 [Bacteroidota bacterium]